MKVGRAGGTRGWQGLGLQVALGVGEKLPGEMKAGGLVGPEVGRAWGCRWLWGHGLASPARSSSAGMARCGVLCGDAAEHRFQRSATLQRGKGPNRNEPSQQKFGKKTHKKTIFKNPQLQNTFPFWKAATTSPSFSLQIIGS